MKLLILFMLYKFKHLHIMNGKVKKNLSLEETKNQLVIAEKEKILNMHSLSHYDKLRRSVSIKFTNE